MSAVLEQVEYASVEQRMPMRRVWAMADAATLNIPPIRALVRKHLKEAQVSIDVFARNKRLCTFTNDLNPETAAEYHLEALEFLELMRSRGVAADLILFDPPYSLEQCKRAYESFGRTVTQRDTQIWGRWTEHKRIISEVVRPGGTVISFGWNSCGVGMKYGFTLEEMLIVCHGAGHNDTICTVERKIVSAQVTLFGTPEAGSGESETTSAASLI